MVILQKRVADLTELALVRFVDRARRSTGLKGTVDVLVTSSAEMRLLNRRFSGNDKATDVLSFPATPDNLRRHFAGEIAVSTEIAAQNARTLGHTAAQEIKILVLHGILHLCGLDHERDNGQMERHERELRVRLGLPSGLIERAAAESGKSVRSSTNGAKRAALARPDMGKRLR